MYAGLKMYKLSMPCIWCGKPVKQNRNRRKLYCDKQCRKEKMNHDRMQRNRRYCKECMKAFWIPFRGRQSTKYCSYSCATTANNRIRYTKKAQNPN